MERLTWKKENGEWGLHGYDIKKVPTELYGALFKLKDYEDSEEQWQLPGLPIRIGNIVYTNKSMRGWYFKQKDRPYKARVVFIGINGIDDFINIEFGNGHMLQFAFSEIGKTVFFTKEEAEQALRLETWCPGSEKRNY